MQDRGVRPARHVVAVEADVEVPERHLAIEQRRQHVPQAAGEEGPAAMDADDAETGVVRVALGDLVRDARERPAHVRLPEDDRDGGAVGAGRVVALRAGLVHRFLPGLTGPG